MYPSYDILTIYDLSYIERDSQLTRELYRQLSNKEEKEMTEKKNFFIGQTVIVEGKKEGIYIYDDGDALNSALVLVDGGEEYYEYEYIKPSNKFTFAQVAQGLLKGYFEKGTEFKVNGRSVFVDCGWKGDLGLVDDLGGGFLRMEIGANLIHATWELVPKEEQIKELTLNELEEILGHKVKIKNND